MEDSLRSLCTPLSRPHRADTCASVGSPAGGSASFAPSAAARPDCKLAASARFGPRPDGTRQLSDRFTSLTRSAPVEKKCGSHLRDRSRCVTRGENCRDPSRNHRARPKKARRQRSRGFARPGMGQYGRDAPHIGQDTAIRREAAPVAEDISNSREPGQLCGAALANCPDSLIKPNWSETSPPGCSRNCRSRPFTLASQFSRSALPSKTQHHWLRAGATRPVAGDAVTQQTRRQGQRLRGGLA